MPDQEGRWHSGAIRAKRALQGAGKWLPRNAWIFISSMKLICMS